jgi:ABC-2 type transport system ATP-binding protein
VVAIRELIRGMNRSQGTTFLISSHLLHEVEITCTRIGVIRDGRLIADVETSSLAAGRFRIVAEPVPQARQALVTMQGVADVKEDGGAITFRLGGVDPAQVNETLVNAGIKVRELRPVERTLEEFFLDD